MLSDNGNSIEDYRTENIELFLSMYEQQQLVPWVILQHKDLLFPAPPRHPLYPCRRPNTSPCTTAGLIIVLCQEQLQLQLHNFERKLISNFSSDFFVNILSDNIFLQGIQLLLSFDWYHLQFDSRMMGAEIFLYFSLFSFNNWRGEVLIRTKK